MVSAFDAEREPIMDPTIGSLVFKYIAWGQQDDNGGFGVEIEEIESHYCTPEELGLT